VLSVLFHKMQCVLGTPLFWCCLCGKCTTIIKQKPNILLFTNVGRWPASSSDHYWLQLCATNLHVGLHMSFNDMSR
jgi:hypothetical protein